MSFSRYISSVTLVLLYCAGKGGGADDEGLSESCVLVDLADLVDLTLLHGVRVQLAAKGNGKFEILTEPFPPVSAADRQSCPPDSRHLMTVYLAPHPSDLQRPLPERLSACEEQRLVHLARCRPSWGKDAPRLNRCGSEVNVIIRLQDVGVARLFRRDGLTRVDVCLDYFLCGTVCHARDGLTDGASGVDEDTRFLRANGG